MCKSWILRILGGYSFMNFHFNQTSIFQSFKVAKEARGGPKHGRRSYEVEGRGRAGGSTDEEGGKRGSGSEARTSKP